METICGTQIDNITGQFQSVRVHSLMLMINGNEKISLIKEYRRLSGKGLKESKEAIERAQEGPHYPSYHFNPDVMIRVFREINPARNLNLTSAQIVKFVEDALTFGERLYLDPIQAFELASKQLLDKNVVQRLMVDSR